jgi:hypothetical protein
MVNKAPGPPTHHRKPYTSCRALKALWAGGRVSPRMNAIFRIRDRTFAIAWLGTQLVGLTFAKCPGSRYAALRSVRVKRDRLTARRKLPLSPTLTSHSGIPAIQNAFSIIGSTKGLPFMQSTSVARDPFVA